MRGSGDSEGVLLGEYPTQEQDDALEVLAWIAAQPWCTGKIGMIGISWGGFNGLQIAATRPPELKAVISLCSTDDRYADDIHFMGGCLLVDKFVWGSTMFSIRHPARSGAGRRQMAGDVDEPARTGRLLHGRGSSSATSFAPITCLRTSSRCVLPRCRPTPPRC